LRRCLLVFLPESEGNPDAKRNEEIK